MQSRASRLLTAAFFAALFSFPYAPAAAQQAALPKVGCIDPAIRLQADEIKKHFLAQGMEVYRDAMIGMESQLPYPIMINLQRGQLYQIIYVAHPDATRLWLDTYDGADNKVGTVMQSIGRGQPTYISSSFVPQTTDLYMFVARQKLKDKSMCGSITILRPKAGSNSVKLTPYVQ